MIRIFTHVGLDPRTGGGVATYVRNLKAVLNASSREYEIRSVSQFSKFFILIAFLRYFSFRGPVLLNSAAPSIFTAHDPFLAQQKSDSHAAR